MKGWIPIQRKLFKHLFWEEKREYSRFEAWIDLIQSVSYEDRSGGIIANKQVEWGRGEMAISITFLSNRWKWSSGKVRRYLDYLKKESMITVRVENSISILLVLNYNEYNYQNDQKNTAGQTAGQTTQYPAGQTAGLNSMIPSDAEEERQGSSISNRHGKRQGSSTQLNKVNNINKINNTLGGEKFVLEYEKIQKLITESINLNSLENLSEIKYNALRKKYSFEQIQETLTQMENWKGIKNKSSLYLTALNWLKREFSEEKKDYEKYVEIYKDWLKTTRSVSARITTNEKKALNEIIVYLQKNTKEPLRSWKYIFENWFKLEPFYQKRIKIAEINKDLINIIAAIKNSKLENKSEKQDIDGIEH